MGGKGGEEVQQGDRVAGGGHAHLAQPFIKLPPAKQVMPIPNVNPIFQLPVWFSLHRTSPLPLSADIT